MKKILILLVFLAASLSLFGQRVGAGVYVFFAEVGVLPDKKVIIKGDITVIY
jgi:hypothetical protein